jgi:hypothetical protein
MKHTEKITPLAATLSALATLACCLPVGFAAAAATAGLGAMVSAYRSWFLAASVVLLIVGGFQLVRARRACATRGNASVIILGASVLVVALVIFFPQVIAGARGRRIGTD